MILWFFGFCLWFQWWNKHLSIIMKRVRKFSSLASNASNWIVDRSHLLRFCWRTKHSRDHPAETFENRSSFVRIVSALSLEILSICFFLTIFIRWSFIIMSWAKSMYLAVAVGGIHVTKLSSILSLSRFNSFTQHWIVGYNRALSVTFFTMSSCISYEVTPFKRKCFMTTRYRFCPFSL